jgi:cardiolipin synthase C
MTAALSRFGKACILAWALLLTACGSLPPNEGRTASFALPDTSDTRLGRNIGPLSSLHPGKSGVMPLADGRAAYASRVALARAAMKSIDVQTFVWYDDGLGSYLFEEMLQAAERGVRVRLLIDDATTGGLDPILAMLDAQPNIQVRLYNPFVGRTSRGLAMIGDFDRLNHRMHNKSFTVDNQATIVGGRNIANEYYEAGQDFTFADVDVVAIGAVVPAVSAEFDLYWNSESAYPARLIVNPALALSRQGYGQKVRDWMATSEAERYGDALLSNEEVKKLLAGQLAFEWTTAQVVHDDPEKTFHVSEKYQLIPQLAVIWESAQEQVDFISPYFVPGEGGTNNLVALARRGVKVRVLTNSLASTDQSAVHMGYAKRRKALLRGGVQLFEFKPTAQKTRERSDEIKSNAQAGLHAKTFAIDRRRIFVGSFNLDPRSARLNTEMGLLIDSPKLAGMLSHSIDTATNGTAYELRLDPQGDVEWLDGTGGPPLTSEPGVNVFRSLWVRFLSLFPIDWLL